MRPDLKRPDSQPLPLPLFAFEPVYDGQLACPQPVFVQRENLFDRLPSEVIEHIFAFVAASGRHDASLMFFGQLSGRFHSVIQHFLQHHTDGALYLREQKAACWARRWQHVCDWLVKPQRLIHLTGTGDTVPENAVAKDSVDNCLPVVLASCATAWKPEMTQALANLAAPVLQLAISDFGGMPAFGTSSTTDEYCDPGRLLKAQASGKALAIVISLAPRFDTAHARAQFRQLFDCMGRHPIVYKLSIDCKQKTEPWEGGQPDQLLPGAEINNLVSNLGPVHELSLKLPLSDVQVQALTAALLNSPPPSLGRLYLTVPRYNAVLIMALYSAVEKINADRVKHGRTGLVLSVEELGYDYRMANPGDDVIPITLRGPLTTNFAVGTTEDSDDSVFSSDSDATDSEED